jgi:small subunit ribosomal protein S2
MEGAGVDLGALEEGNIEEAIAADAPAEEAAEG